MNRLLLKQFKRSQFFIGHRSRIAENPLRAVVRGTIIVLKGMTKYKSVLMK